MYDTLHLWLDSEKINELNYVNRITPFLMDLKYTERSDGEAFYSGSYLGMQVYISNNGISLKGSICKSYLGNNFKVLTRQDSNRAIEMLSDSFHLPWHFSKVGRIDFAHNFIVESYPKNYYSYFGESSQFKRLMQPESIYYQNGLRTKLFYNKVDEGKSKKGDLPHHWTDKNVLRYELRYTSRLPKQFNRSQILAKDLYNENFYIDLIERWVSEYQNINKLKEIELNLNRMNQPKDFFNQILALKLIEIGEPNLMALVEELRAKNMFANKEAYSRLKASIRELCTADDNDKSNDLIKELDTKILQVKEYCR